MKIIKNLMFILLSLLLLLVLEACANNTNGEIEDDAEVISVITDTSKDIVITLNGEEYLEIELGTTFIDPGLNIIGDTSLFSKTKTQNLDTNQVGLYSIEYEIRDLSGTLIETFNRTVKVYTEDLIELINPIYSKITFSSEETHVEIIINSLYQVICHITTLEENLNCDSSYNYMDLEEAVPLILDELNSDNLILGIEHFETNQIENLYKKIDNQLSVIESLDYYFIDAINLSNSYTEHFIGLNQVPIAYVRFFDEVSFYTDILFDSLIDLIEFRRSENLDKDLMDFIPPSFNLNTLRFEVNTLNSWDWKSSIKDIEDNVFDDEWLQIQIEENVQFNSVGDYFVDVIITDPAGNSRQMLTKVSIVDTNSPVIDLTYYPEFSEREISASDKFVDAKIGNHNAINNNYFLVANSDRNRVYVYKINDPQYERIIRLENANNSLRKREDGFGWRVFLNNNQIIIFDRFSTTISEQTIGSVYIYDLIDESYSYVIHNELLNSEFQDISVSNDILVIQSSNLGYYIYELDTISLKEYYQPTYKSYGGFVGPGRLVFDGKFLVSVLNTGGCSGISPDRDEVVIVYNVIEQIVVYEETNFSRYCGGFWFTYLYKSNLIIYKMNYEYVNGVQISNGDIIEIINLNTSMELDDSKKNFIISMVTPNFFNILENSKYLIRSDLKESTISLFDSSSLIEIKTINTKTSVSGKRSINDKFILTSNPQSQDFYYNAGKSYLINIDNGYQVIIIDDSPITTQLFRDTKLVAFPSDGFVTGIGNYQLIVVDDSGNTSTVEFSIDE
jgi:hypothetical protein